MDADKLHLYFEFQQIKLTHYFIIIFKFANKVSKEYNTNN